MPDNNKAINKVVYGDRTLIDLTDTTATAEEILSGFGAYGADGKWVDGTVVLAPNGDYLPYGLANTSPIVDVGQSDYMIVDEDEYTETPPIVGVGRVGYTTLSDDTEAAPVVGEGLVGYSELEEGS